MQKVTDPFLIEEKREYFARKKDKKNFRKQYNKNNPSIPNTNTDELWSDLNFSNILELSGSPIYKDKVKKIITIINNYSGKLLDIGFGSAIIEEKLKKTEIQLYGIDISTKSVKEVKKRVYGNFKRGDILKIPFKSNFFDVVLCLDILEHISPQNTFSALKEVNRVLKKKSILVISIPMNEGLKEMIKETKINPNAHVRAYTPDIIRMELAISGFKIIQESYMSAFKKQYKLKKLLNMILEIKKPNLMIIVAKKK